MLSLVWTQGASDMAYGITYCGGITKYPTRVRPLAGLDGAEWETLRIECGKEMNGSQSSQN